MNKTLNLVFALMACLCIGCSPVQVYKYRDKHGHLMYHYRIVLNH